MHLFPERSYRQGRRFLVIALLLSLVIHAIGGGIWEYYGRRIATVVAKLMPRPTPTPEIVALSDAIRIEKRTVPRVAQRARATRPPQRPRPRVQPRTPVVAAIAVPTMPPLETPRPTHEPVPVPTMHSERATIHRPIATETAPPRPEPSVAPTSHALSPQQIAQLDAQFKQTIDSAQRALTDPPRRGGPANVPYQRQPPSVNRMRYEQIMAGTPDQFLSAQGDCVPLQGPMIGGGLRAYYIRCLIRYSDGYFEQVSFPWTFRFGRRNDPFDFAINPDGKLHFPMQSPPVGFTLPDNFALSRAVCSFFRPQCAAVINAEVQRGDPSYGKPP